MNSAMSGLAKFMEYRGDNLEAIGACPTCTSWKVDFHGMAGVTQAWWGAAVKALTAWLGQSANEDLHTLQINCPERVTFDSPKWLTAPGLQREVLGQDGKSDRHALTQVIARATRIRECASKVEAVYVYEKKGAFRTMLKHARVVCVACSSYSKGARTSSRSPARKNAPRWQRLAWIPSTLTGFWGPCRRSSCRRCGRCARPSRGARTPSSTRRGSIATRRLGTSVVATHVGAQRPSYDD